MFSSSSCQKIKFICEFRQDLSNQINGARFEFFNSSPAQLSVILIVVITKGRDLNCCHNFSRDLYWYFCFTFVLPVLGADSPGPARRWSVCRSGSSPGDRKFLNHLLRTQFSHNRFFSFFSRRISSSVAFRMQFKTCRPSQRRR